MKQFKNVLLTALGIMLAIFAVGLGLFIFFIYRALMGEPAYITGLFMAAILTFILASLSYYFRKKRLCIGLSFLFLICSIGGFSLQLRYNAIQELAVVRDDDAAIFNNYTPFSTNTKAIQLEEVSLYLQDDLPRLDGATALYPIYASFVQNVYPKAHYGWYEYYEDQSAEKEEEGLVVCSKTPNAYQRLIEGRADIIFVAGPSEKQREAAKEAGVEFELTPIGKEAFVFFVNSTNPLNELSLTEIQNIYAGEITHWNQAGGNNQAIKAFQRPEGSGSQSALQRLMKDIPIMEPIEEDVIMGMGGILHQTANYRNFSNALGYSFRFYSTELVKEQQIKLLAINGIEPTKENIINGTYPITSDFYAVTLKGHENPNIDLLLEWIQGEQGQLIIDKVGYVSLNNK